jgi:hypothetical protein
VISAISAVAKVSVTTYAPQPIAPSTVPITIVVR